jgi:hypothetical protein
MAFVQYFRTWQKGAVPGGDGDDALGGCCAAATAARGGDYWAKRVPLAPPWRWLSGAGYGMPV